MPKQTKNKTALDTPSDSGEASTIPQEGSIEDQQRVPENWSTTPWWLTEGSPMARASFTPPTYTFSGLPQEDVNAFIEHWRNALTRNAVPSPLWVPQLYTVLQGAAGKWAEAMKASPTTFEDLTEGLRSKFRKKRKAQLQQRFLTEQQKRDEDLYTFVLNKKILGRSVDPQMEEEDIIDTTLKLMKPHYANMFLSQRDLDLPELLRQCLALDDAVERASKTTNTPTSSEKTALQKPKETQSRPPPGNTLPQCHHCPEKHYHRDCPVLRQRRVDNPVKCFRCGGPHYASECAGPQPQRSWRREEPRAEQSQGAAKTKN